MGESQKEMSFSYFPLLMFLPKEGAETSASDSETCQTLKRVSGFSFGLSQNSTEASICGWNINPAPDN